MEPVVLDHGTFHIRAGYANPDNDPQLDLSSTLCPVRGNEIPHSMERVSSAIDEGNLVHPIERGQIMNWEAMEDVWHYVLYDQLGWEIGNEGQILVAEPFSTPKQARERLAQVMFETFNCMGLYSVEQALLSLYAVGRLTGCTVDIGHGKTEIVPIIDGAIQHAAAQVLPFAGQDVDRLLQEGLSKLNTRTRVDQNIVKSVKHSICSVSSSSEAFDDQANEDLSEDHVLPDGQVIKLGREKLEGGEAFFRPQIIGLEDYGIPEQLLRCVNLCSTLESQRQVLDNVVLVGGSSQIKGFEDRFVRSITSAASPSLTPTIVKVPDYLPESTTTNAAWLGGAILAKVVFAQNQHVSKADYDECGPVIVHRKCP